MLSGANFLIHPEIRLKRKFLWMVWWYSCGIPSITNPLCTVWILSTNKTVSRNNNKKNEWWNNRLNLKRNVPTKKPSMQKYFDRRNQKYCRHENTLTSECRSVYMSTRERPSAVRIFGSSDSGTCSVIRLHKDWPGLAPKLVSIGTLHANGIVGVNRNRKKLQKHNNMHIYIHIHTFT